mmetsp:Transcript_6916/g.11448  ORF Transcript_6916/g.11448 Transcript_6916/m.11448 type:complete len:98 (+) Transcript_6916:752-1045(+)|eukprot:CAMPEP_0119029910 /NCGR_PEP_ID=MMETSP1176-20130426/40759_1 /TAXON_ID=265551 /ORGANISM="Synedropsis recta cf, Strain CCMP1620" /LENGTH=97 /DNA_ID=CAMNT_0006986271 /DNA_START=1046 /DNA_END=1339 /DNA_ORIENTATION=+
MSTSKTMSTSTTTASAPLFQHQAATSCAPSKPYNPLPSEIRPSVSLDAVAPIAHQAAISCQSSKPYNPLPNHSGADGGAGLQMRKQRSTVGIDTGSE